MATVNVTFLPSNKTVQAETGEKITDIAMANDLPIQMACGGSSACSTCRIIVQEGTLNEKGDMEEMWGLPDNERLGCQACLEDTDVIIELPN